MLNQMVTREEWTVDVCSMVTNELLRGSQLGLLTTSEAQQLTSRFLVLLDQALDLPAVRTSLAALNPWACATHPASQDDRAGQPQPG